MCSSDLGQNVTHQYGEWLRANGSAKGGNNGSKSFSFNSHNTGSENQGNAKGQTLENEPQNTPASEGRESTSHGSVQDSKNSKKLKSSCMSDQVRGGDVLGNSECQRAENGIRFDILKTEERVQRQEVVSRDREPTPSPKEVSGMRESEGEVLSKMGQNAQKSMSDVLSKMGQNTLKTNDHPEVTSPHKPLKPAHFEDNKEQRSDQGIIKAQGGRGRIKKLARELGPAQGMDSETKNLIIGTKRLGSQIFSECDEKVARKKKCDGGIGNPNDELVLAVAAVQHRREP